MSRSKKLLGLLAALLVLALAAFAATRLNPENQESEAENDDGVSIFALDTGSVTALSWTYGEESLTFENVGDGWAYAQDSSFPLDSTYIDAMLSALSNVTASKTIEDPEDLSQYGLEAPVCTISVTAGDTTELLIGDETVLDGDRYLSLGDGNVYLVDAALLDSFSYGLYDLVEKESIPSMTDVLSLSVDTGAQQLVLEHLEDSGLAYSDEYVWFMQQEDGYLPLDTELTQALLANITGLTWGGCVDYHASSEALEGYGLGSGAATVTVRYVESADAEDSGPSETEKTFVLELGAAADDGRYARIAGSDMVYLVDAGAAESLLYTTYVELLPDEVLLMDWDTVTAIDIALEDEVYHITRDEQEVTGDDGSTSTETVYTLNGETIDLAGILDSLTALASTGGASTVTPDSGAEISFTFYRDTETFSEVTLAFYPYNSGSCLVTLNGASTVFVARDDIAALLESIRAVL